MPRPFPPFVALGLALASLALAAGPLQPDATQKPLRWGPFTVTVRTVGEFAQTATVTAADGRVLKSFKAAAITPELVDVTGDGVKDLHVNLYSGGAHCCTTDVYDALTPATGTAAGVANLLVFQAGNFGIERWQDLDGDGRPEAIASSDVLAYFGDLSFAVSPGVKLVLAWNGRRYVDATKRFPAVAQAEARDDQQRYLQARAQKQEADLRHASLLGYLANLSAAGREPEARAWLAAHARPEERAWLARWAADLRAALAATPGKVLQSQAREISDAMN